MSTSHTPSLGLRRQGGVALGPVHPRGWPGAGRPKHLAPHKNGPKTRPTSNVKHIAPCRWPRSGPHPPPWRLGLRVPRAWTPGPQGVHRWGARRLTSQKKGLYRDFAWSRALNARWAQGEGAFYTPARPGCHWGCGPCFHQGVQLTNGAGLGSGWVSAQATHKKIVPSLGNA